MAELTVLNERRIRGLYAEIDTSAAMIALVKYTRDPLLVRKYTEVALRSYLAALDLVLMCTFPPRDEDAMWDHLAPVRQWLERERILDEKNDEAPESPMPYFSSLEPDVG